MTAKVAKGAALRYDATVCGQACETPPARPGSRETDHDQQRTEAARRAAGAPVEADEDRTEDDEGLLKRETPPVLQRGALERDRDGRRPEGEVDECTSATRRLLRPKGDRATADTECANCAVGASSPSVLCAPTPTLARPRPGAVFHGCNEFITRFCHPAR
jgi:hypothetical protein